MPASVSSASRALLKGKVWVAIWSIGSRPEAMNWIASLHRAVRVTVRHDQLNLLAGGGVAQVRASRDPTAASTMFALPFVSHGKRPCSTQPFPPPVTFTTTFTPSPPV